jgi:hypothetical protein
MPQGLGFSPDGKTLACHSRIERPQQVFPGWTMDLVGFACDLPPPPMSVVALGELAFNPDGATGATIAVGSTGGGSWWPYRNGLLGSGEIKRAADVLRVYRVFDGSPCFA